VRVLRIIARLNMGGPAYHAALLSALLDDGVQTLLVSGEVGPGEASLASLVDDYGIHHRLVRCLGPEVRPLEDLCATVQLVRLVRRFRPDLVHTHTAKAGALGRLAVLLAARPHPVVVHTFHGHVLEHYFGPVTTAIYRATERALARATDRLVGVSQATVDDLVRLRIAPRSKFRVVPLGLELDRFRELDAGMRADFRREVGAGEGDVLFTYVGRLVPIKRVDLMLRSFARARAVDPRIRLAIVGDGELRAELESLSRSLGLEKQVRFLGYRSDLERIAAGADAALLTSASEGTPVSLIEAAAAGRPAIATAVGGVPDVVVEDAGLLVQAGDEAGLAAAIERMAADRDARKAMGQKARSHVLERFAISRLVADIDALYEELLEHAERGSRRRGADAEPTAGQRYETDD
jgi:glycosyltransferase involved in cell wall biosynthesis